MDQFIPLQKRTKKQQKEFHAKQRSTWGEVNPVTRTMPNGKGYDRNKQKQKDRRNGSLSYGNEDGCRFILKHGAVVSVSFIRLGATLTTAPCFTLSWQYKLE